MCVPSGKTTRSKSEFTQCFSCVYHFHPQVALARCDYYVLSVWGIVDTQ